MLVVVFWNENVELLWPGNDVMNFKNILAEKFCKKGVYLFKIPLVFLQN
jgi:hypothetical protein